MEKIYSFKKEIIFKTNIYDILSIAIDKKFNIDGYAIKGKFKINGEYLINEQEKEVFDIDIPYLNYIEDTYDISNIKVDIDDFYYEVKDSTKLVINIDIKVSNLEERCIDSDEPVDDEYDIEVDSKEDIKEQGVSRNESFTNNINSSYVTYKVCIVRENDTIESIVEKYNTSLELLKKYNVINDIKIGDKIIIPYAKD